jgi:(S)-2-hydroxy-acid oxidase
MLAASPLFFPKFDRSVLADFRAFDSGAYESPEDAIQEYVHADNLITTPQEALDVLDFEAVARKNLPPGHFGYLSTGTDDDGTLRANREGFTRLELRARRLVDLTKIDTSVRLMGTNWPTPIVLSPVSNQRAFNPEGENAVAKAARVKNHLQILSTSATSSIEEVVAARGAPIWFQLYPTNLWTVTQGMLKRAENVGCPVVALTTDLQGGSNRETLQRLERMDTRQCSTCHGNGFAGHVHHEPMFDGLDVSKVTSYVPRDMNWDFVKRLKDATTMKVFIKGIVTREDAELAVETGVDGIIVSNHGGRGEASNRSTIESLPEVVAAVNGKFPVLIDGGFRRGGDIFKALALGADAICIGRPYIWGLAAFGQPGVEMVLEILRRELEMIMRQMGTTSIAKITKASLIPRPQ